MSDRTWIGYVLEISGEHQKSDTVLVPANDEGQKPDTEQLKAWTLDWYGYDHEDGEQMWDSGEGSWWIDDVIIFPVRLIRELTPVEVMIWDIAQALPTRPFCLNDFMMLAELNDET